MGLKKLRGHQIPAMNCRAIFECPYGTGKKGVTLILVEKINRCDPFSFPQIIRLKRKGRRERRSNLNNLDELIEAVYW
jgi:hypothetical protein